MLLVALEVRKSETAVTKARGGGCETAGQARDAC